MEAMLIFKKFNSVLTKKIILLSGKKGKTTFQKFALHYTLLYFGRWIATEEGSNYAIT